METSHCIVLVIAVGLVTYTQNTAGLHNSCPADGFFKNDGSYKVDDVIYLDDGIAVCTHDLCYKTTHDTLEKYYGTLFSEDKTYDSFVEACRGPDGDRCCPTYFNNTAYEGDMQDVNNDTCKIIKLPKQGRNNTTRFQHVTEGFCCPGAICTLTHKDCRQMLVPQPLLARKKGDGIQKMAFYQFNVPAYCVCLNV